MKPARVVIDTNCLVSALIFSRGRLAWLREAWQSRRVVPLVSHDTAAELLRVLQYPKFHLTGPEVQDLLAEFLPYAEAVTELLPAAAGLPSLRDPNDVMFLQLALNGNADALVSGDADLLDVKHSVHIPILAPAEFAGWLAQH
jgi:putative PIN family toxin of toxin-antitoxin system